MSARGLLAGNVDRFSVIGQCAVVEGWASQRDLQLTLDGNPLAATYTRVRRTDLVQQFGADAEEWGFSLCAALPIADLEVGRLVLRLNAGITTGLPPPEQSKEDPRYAAMFERFRAAIESRPGRLLEIGSRARSGIVWRHVFAPGIDYVGLDIKAGPNVTVVGDAHQLSRHVGGPFDFIFSVSVFEHLIMPWRVALEMNKVLAPDGLAMIVSHASWPLHDEPWDFLRFSVQAWRGLFNAHTGFELLDAQYCHPASIVPRFSSSAAWQQMPSSPTYLLSGCLVRRSGPAKVSWDADPAEVFDLAYSHG